MCEYSNHPKFDSRLHRDLRQCFSLDLINLHLLQYTSRGILMIFGLLLLQSAASIYAVYSPHDLLKQGSFTSYSTYTRLGGSLVQACWIFMGQLLFAWFYVYSLYSSYSDIGNAEYLFWQRPQGAIQNVGFIFRVNGTNVPRYCLGLPGLPWWNPTSRACDSACQYKSNWTALTHTYGTYMPPSSYENCRASSSLKMGYPSINLVKHG